MRDATQLTESEKRHIRNRYESGDTPDNLAKVYDIKTTDVMNLCFDIELEPEAKKTQLRTIASTQLALQNAHLERIGFKEEYIKKMNRKHEEIFKKIGPLISMGLDRVIDMVENEEKILTIPEIQALIGIYTKIGSPDLPLLNFLLKLEELKQSAGAVKESANKQSVFSGPIRNAKVIPVESEDSKE